MNKKNKIILSFFLHALISLTVVFLTIYFLENLTADEKQKISLVKNINQKESCLSCHSEIQGIEESHSPNKIGCYSCHLGNPNAIEKNEAHANMILIPGNLNDIEFTCGSSNCHPQMISRMKNNIMNTMNGVVTVDKWVFGEATSPTFKNSIHEIKFSPAEKHLRNLCASCHLSNIKSELGPINELSRGGGCLACHLNYSNNALFELKNSSKQLTKFHPNIDIKINNSHCFGCHSRSGRISLSYDGWHETLYKPEDVKSKIGFRVLDDGRVVKQIQKDIHSEKGLLCVDCHNSYEIMGDGNYYLHKEEQLQIQCIDCHLIDNPKTKKINEFDFESKKIAELNNTNDNSRNYLLTKNEIPYTNVFYEKGKTFLIKKNNKEKVEIKKPSFVCTEGKAHKDLSCNTCHNSWTPQCIGCHTEYDENSTMFDLLDNKEADGEWLEHPKDLLAETTTLAVRQSPNKREIIEVMPGMILTIKKSKNESPIFKRLFAPAFSHTIRKEAKSCQECHLNPVVLGYGRGKLEYKITNGKGSFIFTPNYPNSKIDNLPEDAWIGFLKEKKYNVATRENIRTFSVDEQKRILTLGSCLSCHKSNSKVINATLYDFDKVISLKSKKCIIPNW
ncbi:MAG: hypothetical protein N2321_10605 [Melioribacteraceae bacterium]|nr:hypothetical protein [Melioribacteraceae bacterium]